MKTKKPNKLQDEVNELRAGILELGEQLLELAEIVGVAIGRINSLENDPIIFFKYDEKIM